MSNQKIIGSGAEAIIYLDADKVIKDRIKKEYRLPEIDIALRKYRTRREAKILDTLSSIGFPGPKLIDFCDKDMKINMNFIDGMKIRDILHKNYLKFSKEIGRKVAMLHKNNIIHGDLTTSNMILDTKTNEIYFIDFGLSFFSNKIEDKAVDLHLLRQALESKHYKIYEKCFEAVLDGYKKENPEFKKIFERLEKVEKRGRNKEKGMKY